MPADEQQKWRSPTGHPIASLETDHIPDGGRMVSKPMNDLKTVRGTLENDLDIVKKYINSQTDFSIEAHDALARISVALTRMIETPAPTEKVEQIEGLEDVYAREGYDPIEIKNKFGKYPTQIVDIAARAYLELQNAVPTQED